MIGRQSGRVTGWQGCGDRCVVLPVGCWGARPARPWARASLLSPPLPPMAVCDRLSVPLAAMSGAGDRVERAARYQPQRHHWLPRSQPALLPNKPLPPLSPDFAARAGSRPQPPQAGALQRSP